MLAVAQVSRRFGTRLTVAKFDSKSTLSERPYNRHAILRLIILLILQGARINLELASLNIVDSTSL